MGEKVSRIVEEPLEPLIFSARGQRVILDADLARLYGVTTKALNQAVHRNANRFPSDFALRLSLEEAANLKSQIVTSSPSSHDGARKPNRVFAQRGCSANERFRSSSVRSIA